MKYTLEQAQAQLAKAEAAAPQEAGDSALEPADAPESESVAARPFDMEAVARDYDAAVANINTSLPLADQIAARNAAVNAAVDASIEPYADYIVASWEKWRNTLDGMSKVDRSGFANFSMGFENDHQTRKALTTLTETLNGIFVDHINFVMPKDGADKLDAVDMSFFDCIVSGYEQLAVQVNNTPFYRSDENGVGLWMKVCKPNVTYFEKRFKAWTDAKLEIYFGNHAGAREEYAQLEKTLAQEEAAVAKAKKKARFFGKKDREKAAQSDALDAAKAAENDFRRHAIEEVLSA